MPWRSMGGSGGTGPGTTDHAALSHLDKASSGHTGFADSTHAHVEGDVTGLVGDLAAKETPAGAAAQITTHAGLTTSVHGFDASGNSPAQSHDNTRHTAAFALSSDLSTHTGLTTTAHGGLLPGTAFSGLAKITVSASEPGSPSVGDLWIQTV
jgi:hypothetical protein